MLENPMVMPEPHYWLPPVKLVLVDLSKLEPKIKDFNRQLLGEFKREKGIE